jgi:hypothetical protein
MKNLLLILLYLFSSFSFAAKPWEIPIDQQKWHWAWIGSQANNIDNVIYVDFTKLEKMPDGSMIYPWADADKKNNKWLSSVGWNKVDCQSKTSDFLGRFSNGAFELAAAPQRYPVNSLGHSALNMICGIKTDSGELIYGIGGQNVNGTIIPYGVMFKDIVVDSLDSNKLSVKNYLYDPVSGKMFNGHTGHLNVYDCVNKNMTNSEGKIFSAEKDGLEYAVRFICDAGKIKSNKGSQPNTNTFKLPEARQKCKDLGFKEKTEKFGSCVLELTK